MADQSKKIDPDFPVECLQYKQLLREIRSGLCPQVKQFAEMCSFKYGLYFKLEGIPYVGSTYGYRFLPKQSVHDEIVAKFKELDTGTEFTTKIETLESLYKEHVIPEFAARIGRGPKVSAQAVKDATAKRLLALDCKTALTKRLVVEMSARRFYFNGKSQQEIINCLDSPRNSSARGRLEKILADQSFEDLTEDEKTNFRYLFFDNCLNSCISIIDKDDEFISNPIIAYKATLGALLLQSGVSVVDLSRELSLDKPIIDLHELFALPSPEQHKQICDFFEEMRGQNPTGLPCDEEDFAELKKVYKAAYSEKWRLSNNMGPKIKPADAKTELGKFILELMDGNKISYTELAEYMKITDEACKGWVVSKRPKSEKIGRVVAALCKKSEECHLKGDDLLGKRMVLGFSGLSWADDIKLRELYIESLVKPVFRQ